MANQATKESPSDVLTMTREEFDNAVKEKKHQDERLTTILHALDFPVLRILPDNTIEFANNATLEHADMMKRADGSPGRNADLHGLDVTRFMPEADHEAFEQMKLMAKERRLNNDGKFRIGVKADIPFVSRSGDETPTQLTITYAASLDRYQLSFADITELKAAQSELELAHAQLEERIREATEEVRRQTEAIMEMSTPVIRLWPGIILLPLVGTIDTARANQMGAALLEAAAQTEAQVAILDLTGIAVVDTAVARHVLQTVHAARLLGTNVILTGINPGMAQTLSTLGVDFGSVITRGNLQTAVEDALKILRQRIVQI